MKNNGQIRLPFLKRETFFSGRSHMQTRIPFPLTLKNLAGISSQQILFTGHPEKSDSSFREPDGLLHAVSI
ncbi:MAG: hypothetical protein R2941_13570 [Desulfobacterales bacterium]